MPGLCQGYTSGTIPYQSITVSSELHARGCLPSRTVQVWNPPSAEGEQEERYVEDVIMCYPCWEQKFH